MKNKKLISTILTITMFLALTGCEQKVSTPSVLTPTSTPTAEPVATETPAPTEALEPTMAPTEAPVATETPVPTATLTEAPREESVWTETNRIESTCTVSGLVTYTDQYGETKTEELPLAAHTPGEPEVIPATVDEEGLVVVRCTVCGEIISSEVLPRLTPTNTPVPTNTPTNTPKPTATNTPKPTATNTPKPTATNTPTPEPTKSVTVTVYDAYYKDGSDYLTTVTRGSWTFPAGKVTREWYALSLNEREFVSGVNGVRGVAFMDVAANGVDWTAAYANGSNQKIGGITPNDETNITITYKYKVTFDYYAYATATPTPAGSSSGANVTQMAGGNGGNSGNGGSGSGSSGYSGGGSSSGGSSSGNGSGGSSGSGSGSSGGSGNSDSGSGSSSGGSGNGNSGSGEYVDTGFQGTIEVPGTIHHLDGTVEDTTWTTTGGSSDGSSETRSYGSCETGYEVIEYANGKRVTTDWEEGEQIIEYNGEVWVYDLATGELIVHY